MRFAFPLAAVTLLLLSGCTDPTPAAVSVDTAPLVQFGSIIGTVLDDEQVPLANITVVLTAANEQTLTAADGSFAFRKAPVGRQSLVAAHPHYNETARDLHVLPDETSLVEITLVKRPAFQPRNLTLLYEGGFDCGAEAPIVTGPCWILVEGTTCGPPINYCVHDPAFKSDYAYPFMVEPRWETVIVELTWSAGASGLDGMRLYLENANGTVQGQHGVAVSKVHGNEQPLRTRVDRGQPAVGYEVYEGTKTPAFIPEDGGDQQVRVFPKGQGYEYTRQVCDGDGRCFLGVGAGLNVRFTAYVTVFYNEVAPEGFTAVPAA